MTTSNEIKMEIERTEAAGQALEGKQGMLSDRGTFLRAELKSLAWPVSQNDEKATVRASEIGSELTELDRAIESTAGQLEAAALILAGLREDLSRAELAEAEEQRDRLALEEAGYLLEMLDHQAAIESLRYQVEQVHPKASEVNYSVTKRGGAEIPIGWPRGSDTLKRADLVARVEMLKNRLGKK